MRRAQLPIIPSDVLAELRQICDDATLRHQDMMQWGKKRPQQVSNETIYFLPKLGIFVAVRRVKDG